MANAFYNILAEEAVSIGSTATAAFTNAPDGTKLIRWTVLGGGKVVYRLSGVAGSSPSGVTDGHESYGDDWRMGKTDALRVFMLDYAGATVTIFVSYLGGRLLEADV